jgi:hypothetical protein
MLVEVLFAYLFNLLSRWIRRSRLTQYAKAHGYSFYEEDRNNRIQFSGMPFTQSPSESYKLSHAANIIQGAISGLKFIYFEKTQIQVSEDGREKPSGTRSMIAIDKSANDRFESSITFDKSLIFYREDGTICFYWNGANSDGVKPIPVDELDQWLSDIASAVKVEVVSAN